MYAIGNVPLTTNLLLAPIAGFCDLAFRLVVRSVAGVDGRGSVGLTSTDLLCPHAILNENHKTLWLTATSPLDQPVCMQLYGRHPDSLCDAARWAEAHGAKIIDLNMGCPVDKVTKKNGGSKLLTEPCLAVEIIEKLLRAVSVPVTAKIRLGWDDDSLITRTLPIKLADAGVAAITVHGRTTQQKFRGNVRLEGIAQVVETVKRHHPQVRIHGNGDIKQPQDAKHMLDVTGCDGVMIGRGALGQPWIFRDTAYYLTTGQHAPPLPQADRVKLVLMHLNNIDHFRSERIAVNLMRQRMHWYGKHLQPWPGLKHDVQTLSSVTAWRDYLSRGLERVDMQAGVRQ